MTILTISTVTSPGLALPAGSRLYRHVVPLATPMNPVAAAAALRTDGRVMLTAGSDGRRATLAVGELAVLSHPGGAGHAPLADAVDFLAGLDIPADTPDPEAAWYGLLGYDAVRDFERLPSRHPATDRPVYEFFLPETLVQFTDGYGQVIGRGPSAAAARAAAERVARRLDGLAVAPLGIVAVGAGRFGFSYEEYAAAVDRAKRHILDGDVFQLVLSIAWTAPATVDGLAVFERLTAINPSPYHFWYAGPRFEVVGASPEPCLTLHDGRALIRPLAGTRPRGHDSLADQRAEADLRSSVKELAEHRMLVDLARNDLGRVCRPGSVSVERLMAVERYSHVMHLTSDVCRPNPRRPADRRAHPGNVPCGHHDRHAQGARNGDHRRPRAEPALAVLGCGRLIWTVPRGLVPDDSQHGAVRRGNSPAGGRRHRARLRCVGRVRRMPGEARLGRPRPWRNMKGDAT